MKIANVMLSKANGGMEQSFITQCETFTDMGHEVLSITDKRFAFYSNITHSKKIKYLPWISEKIIKNYINSFDPDILIAHGNRAADLVSKMKNTVNIAIVVHNKSNLPKALGYNNIIAVSENVKNYISPFTASRVTYIPNMVIVPGYKQKKKAEVIMSIGRISPEKGFKNWIDSLYLLKRKGLHFKAVLAGDGPMKKNLIMYAKQIGVDIEFTGWIDDKSKLYQMADIICVPSIEEAFGLVIAEAMSSSCPVVVSDADGPLEIVSHMKNGYITKKGCCVSLAVGIERMMQDDHLRNSIAKRAHQFIKNRYSIEIVKDMWSDFFNSFETNN